MGGATSEAVRGEELRTTSSEQREGSMAARGRRGRGRCNEPIIGKRRTS